MPKLLNDTNKSNPVIGDWLIFTEPQLPHVLISALCSISTLLISTSKICRVSWLPDSWEDKFLLHFSQHNTLCSATPSGLSTFFKIFPACPFRPPAFFPLRLFPLFRLGSWDGALLLFELFLPNLLIAKLKANMITSIAAFNAGEISFSLDKRKRTRSIVSSILMLSIVVRTLCHVYDVKSSLLLMCQIFAE